MVVLVVLLLPLALGLYLLAEALGEGLIYILLIGAFKVVTIGLIRTEFTAGSLDFAWHGFARTSDGKLVASENAVAIIGVLTYLTAGAVWYFGFYRS